MPILWLADGEKRILLSLHGVRQHKWLFLGEARSQTGWLPRFRDLWNSLRYWQSHGQGRGTRRSYSPHPADRVPVPALFATGFPSPKQQIN